MEKRCRVYSPSHGSAWKFGKFYRNFTNEGLSKVCRRSVKDSSKFRRRFVDLHLLPVNYRSLFAFQRLSEQLLKQGDDCPGFYGLSGTRLINVKRVSDARTCLIVHSRTPNRRVEFAQMSTLINRCLSNGKSVATRSYSRCWFHRSFAFLCTPNLRFVDTVIG